MEAASSRIGVAVADLYPQLTLTGRVTVDARTFSSLFSPESIASSIGPALRWDILNFGRVKSRIAAREAQFDQSVVHYQRTVLLAVEEVENGLRGHQSALDRTADLLSARTAAVDAVRLSKARYRQGLIAFQTVLDAQRQRLRIEEQLAASRGNITLSLIRIYKAAGGGWSIDEDDGDD